MSGSPPAPLGPRPAAQERSPRRGMCAAVLALEAVTLGLTTPVMVAVSGVPARSALAVGLGLMLGCLVVAGLLRSEWAYGLGWAVQVAAVSLGLVVPIMFVLGPVFALLWAAAYLLGRRIERDRAAAYGAPQSGMPGRH